jgi:hypothetical protein
MATIWSIYFNQNARSISKTDTAGYTWTLNLPHDGMLEVQTDDIVSVASRVWRFGVKGLMSRVEGFLLDEEVNNPTIDTDGNILDNDGIILVTKPSTGA